MTIASVLYIHILTHYDDNSKCIIYTQHLHVMMTIASVLYIHIRTRYDDNSKCIIYTHTYPL
jgi:hypothetical protein